MEGAYLWVYEEGLGKVFFEASSLRERHFGNRMRLCAILNAKSGLCPEDCAFCAQSKHNRAEVPVYGLLSPEEVLIAAERAKAMGVGRFSIVTSGRRISQGELDKVLKAVELVRSRTGLRVCASLGFLGYKEARRLKEAGLSRYHHNLETAPSFFPKVCTTHSLEEKIETILAAKEAGLEICSGGILGLGEGREERLELALTLKELGVHSVALNFLHPIKGTRFEGAEGIAPVEALRSVALFRVVLPEKDIRICGGRLYTLRDLHPLIFLAGANGLMVGDYLTTRGRDWREDLRMLEDLGFEVEDG